MKTIEIKHRYTGKVIFSCECETIKECLKNAIEKQINLSWANLRGVNLNGVDLRGVDLSGVDLRGANLSWVDLSGVDLQWANLRGANLSGVNLNGVNLSGVDLRGVDLQWANLRGVNLSGVNLSGAKTDKRYVSVSCIGSEKRMTTYCFEDDTVWCGCFTGTLAQFEEQVNETHKDNPQYLKEYVGFINYLK